MLHHVVLIQNLDQYDSMMNNKYVLFYLLMSSVYEIVTLHFSSSDAKYTAPDSEPKGSELKSDPRHERASLLLHKLMKWKNMFLAQDYGSRVVKID